MGRQPFRSVLRGLFKPACTGIAFGVVAGVILDRSYGILVRNAHDSDETTAYIREQATRSSDGGGWTFEAQLEWLVSQPATAQRTSELIDLIGTWAGRSQDAAISALVSVPDPIMRRQIALALVEILGGNEDVIRRVAENLPAREALGFHVDLVALSAYDSPTAALDDVFAFDDPIERQVALRRISPILASRDPTGALSRAGEFGQLAPAFRAHLLVAWAEINPEGVLAYLESVDKSRLPEATAAFELIAAHDPSRLLALVDEFPSDLRRELQEVTLKELVKQDVTAAVAYVEMLPSPTERNRLQELVAVSYGAHDPNAAWNWVQGERSQSPEVRLAVLSGIHRVDADRAFDAVMSELSSESSENRSAMRSQLRPFLSDVAEFGEPSDVGRLFDRIANLEGTTIQGSLQFALEAWSESDASAASQWVFRNLEHVSDRTLSGIARNSTVSNPGLAQQALFQLPDSQRAAWAIGVVRGLAATNPESSESWALGLPFGALRDAALDEHLSSIALRGESDLQLFFALSDDVSRQRAASRVAPRLACQGNASLAYEVLGAYITDPDIQEETRRRVAQNAERGLVCE